MMQILNDAASFSLEFQKSRAGAIVQNQDEIGNYTFQGWDGGAYRTAANISVIVDGTPGSSDMPGALKFSTTPDGSAGALERLRITNGGLVGIGTTSPVRLFSVQGNSIFSGDLTLANQIATGTITTANLSIGSLTGPLQAINGVVSATTTLSGVYGGTGSTTLSGILAGNGAAGVKTLIVGSGLSFDGATLSALAGTAASSTLLADSNTFSGTLTTFINAPVLGSLSGVIYGNSGTLVATATTSVSISGPFIVPSSLAAFGASGAITYTGLATTSNLTQGQLLFNTTGGNGVASVATSSFAITSGLGLSYSGTLGSLVGGTGGTLSISTTTLYSGAANQIPYFTSANTLGATSTLTVNVGGTGSTTPLGGILAGNGSGAIKSVVIGSGLTFDGSTLSATGGGGGSDFIADSYGGILVNSTTSPLWLKGTNPFSLIASSTFATFASSTQLTTTGNTYLATAGGRVGVATTTAREALAVVGNFEISDSAFTKQYRFRTSGSALDLEAAGAPMLLSNWSGAGYTGTQQNYLNLQSSSQTAYVYGNWNFKSGNTGVLTANGNPVLSILGAGSVTNVGVGSTSPYANLAIHANSFDTIRNTLFAIGSSSATATTTLFKISNTGAITVSGLNSALLTTNASGVITASTSLSQLYGGTGSTTPLGGILVGNTTGGLNSLAIGSNLTFDGTTLSATGGSGGAYSFFPFTTYATTTSATTSPLFSAGGFFASTTSSIPSLAITQSGTGPAATFLGGSVGVGTTSPYKLLSIGGDFSIGAPIAGGTNGNFYLLGQAAASGSNCLQIDTAGNVTKTGSACGGSGSSPGGASGALQFNQNGSFAGNLGLTYDFVNSRLGIGTSTPYAMLSLLATSTSNYTNNVLFTIASTSGSTATSLLSIANTGTATFTAPGTPQLILSDNTAVDQWSLRSVNGNLYFATSSVSTLATSTVPTLTMTNAIGTISGLVGIGSSTPWGKLSIELGSYNPAFVISNQGSSTPAFYVGGVNQNGRVGLGTSSPVGTLTVVGGNGPTEPTLYIATTSTNSAGQMPLLVAYATTTGDLDYARVGIGTTSPWGLAGLRDQLTVAGRIYSTWRYASCDVFGANFVTATMLVADTTSLCGPFGFDFGGTTGSYGISTLAGQNYPSFATLRAANTISSTYGTTGAGGSFGMMQTIATASTSPVMESWVRVRGTGSTTPMYIVGLYGADNGQAPQTLPTNGIYFIASTTSTWQAVVRRGSTDRAFIDTGVATSSTAFQKMRIEVASSTAIFLINGSVVAQTGVASNVTLPSRALRPVDLVANIAGSSGGTGDVSPKMDIALFRFWLDDPATGGGDSESSSPAEPIPYDRVNGADIAAAFLADSPGSYIPGMLVVGDTATSSLTDVRKSLKRYDTPLMGAVSTAPREVLGQETGDTIRVAQSGKVPVIVSLENGPIAKGDSITSSSIVGVGMKAVRVGSSVGRALENFDPATQQNQCDVALKDELVNAGVEVPADACLARVMVALDINYSFSVGNFFQDALASLDDINAAVNELSASVFDKGVAYTKLVIQQIVAKVAVIEKLYAAAITVLPGGEVNLPSGPDQVTGAGTLASGNTSVFIANTKAKTGSKVFITLRGLSESPLAVTEIQPGVGFKVETLKAPTKDVIFDWLMITTYDAASTTATSTPQAPPAPTGDPTTQTTVPPGGTSGGDTTPPVVSLTGGASIDIGQGASFLDPGATASDATDGDVTASIQVSGVVDTAIPGAYALTYTATDSAGNVGTATRTVNVTATQGVQAPPEQPPDNSATN
jgi:hypothetical protein